LLAAESGLITCPAQENCTAIMLAAADGHRDIVRQLLELGASINDTDDVIFRSKLYYIYFSLRMLQEGATAFLRACMYGYSDVIQCLLENGANTSDVDNVVIL
jgi:ankyrin repeat protein